MIEVMSAVFAAGETKTYNIPAEYFEVLEALYPFDVLLMQRDGTQLSTIKSAEASYFTRPGRFETFTITSANAQTIRWFLGSGDAGTRRLSGVVQVVDGARSRTVAGAAFLGNAFSAAAAAQFPHCQVFNPAASGKNVIVSGWEISSPTTGAIQYGIIAAQLTTNLGGALSKLAGGAVSAALMTTQTPAANLLVAPYLGSSQITASVPLSKTLKEPVVLRPGYGLTVQHQTAATSLGFNPEFTEESLT